HVQLKGTTDAVKGDGSTSVAVARRNLNYLLVQSHSIYVCHRDPHGPLLVRSAEDVLSAYEQGGHAWTDQETITVRFTEPFDEGYLRRLHAIALARGLSARDDRLGWVAMPPERLGVAVATAVPRITVPASAAAASTLLDDLYERGEDLQLSQSFDQFRAVLGDHAHCLDILYMSEINLGLNDLPFSAERVLEALKYFGKRDAVQPRITPASVAYTLGNAHFALKEYEDAAASLLLAIAFLGDDASAIGAQCYKNLGSVLEASGHHAQAREAFEGAVALDPELAEAHLALGLWYRNHSKDLSQSIEHLDLVAKAPGSALSMRAVHGWRAAVLFELGRTDAAFSAIEVVLAGDRLDDWEWFWCARLVRTHGKESPSARKQALKFWRRFLKFHPDDSRGLSEAFTCEWALHDRDGETRIGFAEFKAHAEALLAFPSVNAGLIWDRVGHWAQTDDNWIEAEAAFRRAFEREPAQYAYCLAVALNHLDRWEETLSVLLPIASTPDADSLVWFQLAFAQERVGNIQGAVEGYRRAIALDAEYALAHFNLGGVLWNEGNLEDAVAAWREAVTRFPEHGLAAKLQRDFPDFFCS
ncbi:MAG TPA: tetratricopeptide repeat protein, partial [Polyangiaceae bacterium]|nr:tetratricopeptide repeat protein [Polyangiaceae bacterium]